MHIENLSKAYGDNQALEQLSLQVGRGELFGLIGPDGAGKTTLFRILVTLLLPDTGTATVEGYDVVKDYRQIRKIIGYMPGNFSLYQDLSVEENLKFFASIFGTTIEENYHMIKSVYKMLEPFKDRRAGKLSGGMKQKLALSCALIHRPDILILDEPTTGVDAVSRKEFWEMLGNLKSKGMTILVSTSYMDEASLCDRVGLIQDGKLMDTGTPAEIIGKYRWPLLAVKASDMYNLKADLESFPKTYSAYRFGEFIHVSMEEPVIDQEMITYLEQTGYRDIVVKVADPTIEDCFMDMSKTG